MNRISKFKLAMGISMAVFGGTVAGTIAYLNPKMIELQAETVSRLDDQLGKSKPRKGKRKIGDERFREAIKKADEAVRRFKEERGVPGVSVGVSVDGKTVWKTGYGYADIEKLHPCEADSAMRIASISKSLTMTLVAKLMQDNRLDMDAPIQKYVPSFPEKEFNGEKVTITTRQLVSHLGGVRHYEKTSESSQATTRAADGTANQKDSKPVTIPTTSEQLAQKTLCSKCQENVEQQRRLAEFEHAEYYNQREYKSVEEALSMFKDDPLQWKPGTKYAYTTHGWTLISAIVEGASGRKFPDLFKDLFSTLGMRETFLDVNGPLIPNRASYYRRIFKPFRLENVPSVNNSYKLAGGGVVSTVSDLLSFANAMLYFYQSCPADSPKTNCYLNRKTLDTIWAPVENASTGKGHYAMGWTRASDQNMNGNGDFYVGHGGGAVGASSVLLLKPSKKAAETGSGGVAVAILTNIQECGGLQQLAFSLVDLFDDCV